MKNQLLLLAVVLLASMVCCVIYDEVTRSPPTGSQLPPHPDFPSAEHIVGPPSLPASYIDQVLAKAQSPTTGLGKTLYQLSQQYHIDNAHALAFFHHESSYGKYGVAATTRNFGNIRCTPGYTCDPTGGYRSYHSWEEGAADWFKLIYEGYIQGRVSVKCPCLTIPEIIPVYAPVADSNDEGAYIKSVLQDVLTYRKAVHP